MAELTHKHYERIIIVCCFLLMFVNVGFPSTAFGVYQPYIVELPGMDHSLGSMVVSIRALVSLGATFMVARYFKRLDCRVGVSLGTAFTGLGFLVYAASSSFPMFAVGSVLCGLGYGFGGAVGMTLLVGRWFNHDIGKASGFAAMGSGVAGLLIPNLAVRVIASSGLAASFLFEAVLALCIAGVAFAFLRNHPRNLGATDEDLEERKAENPQPPHNTVEISQHAHNLLVVAMIGIGAGCTGGVAYISILMISNGIDEVFAALLLSIVGLALCVGKFTVGAVMDALGNRRGTLLFFSIYLVGLVLCCISAPSQNHVLCLIAVFLYGMGAALGTTGISIWTLEFSTLKTRAKMAKDFQSAYAAGGLVFNLIPGVLMELTGTYVISYALMAIMVLISAIIILSVYRHKANR